MLHLPNVPRTFSELLGLSIRYHFTMFRKMVLLILFLVLVKDAYIYLGGMPFNVYGYGVVSIVMGLLMLYLFSALLYIAHCVFHNENINWRSALSDVLVRMGRVLFAFIIFVVVPLVLFAVGEWIGRWIMGGEVRSSKYAGLILVLSVGIPVMFAYLYYLLTIPLIVTENFAIWPAFKRAAVLVGPKWGNMLRVFGVYACGVAIWLLVSPNTLHGHFMRIYKLSAPFDFIVFSVTLPIFMNLLILIRNDLHLRKTIQDADAKQN